MLSWIHSLLPSQVQYTNIFHLRQQCDFITMNLEKDDVEWNWKVWKQSLWSASLGNYFSSSIFWINRNPIKNNIRDRGSTALYTAYTDDTFYTVNIVQTALHWGAKIPVLKVYAHGAHVRGTKASWGNQKLVDLKKY